MYNIDKHAEELKQYPHIKVLTVPGASHDIMAEAPEAVAEALLHPADTWPRSERLRNVQ